MGVIKRPKPRRGELASGHEFFYTRRPSMTAAAVARIAKSESEAAPSSRERATKTTPRIRKNRKAG